MNMPRDLPAAVLNALMSETRKAQRNEVVVAAIYNFLIEARDNPDSQVRDLKTEAVVRQVLDIIESGNVI